MSYKGFSPFSSFPKIAAKTQAMGEMVSASRLLITACLQTWKPELKTLGNPNLGISRLGIVLSPEQLLTSVQKPATVIWQGFTALLRKCKWLLGSIGRNQTLCTPAKVKAITAT